jgi:hypothetical protein
MDEELIAKLVRLLSSDKDGERLGAVAAMQRHLDAQGLDFNDLADRITSGDHSKVAKSLTEAAYNRGHPSWFQMAQTCAADGSLGPRDRDFADQMLWLTARGREPSAKQGQWLASLYARTRRNDDQDRNQSRHRNQSRRSR